MAGARRTGWSSWPLGSVAGVRIVVHPTFLLLVAWFTLAYWLEMHSVARVGSAVALLLLLFVCVLLHELGHALTAQRFGYATREITLLPIGGIARLARMPDDPKHSFWITVAGPAVNVAIAMILFVLLHSTGSWKPIANVSLTDGPFFERLMFANISLVLFNMLPAFPMDGGRALRALLALWLDDRTATHIAARLGQAMAMLFALAGALGNPLLILIALFVWIGAAEEAAMADLRASLRGMRVAQAMRRAFRSLAPDDTLSAAVELVLQSDQRDVPVVDRGRVAGLLTHSDLARGIRAGGPQARVMDVMDREALVVGPEEMVADVLARLDEQQKSAAVVVENHRVVGLITAGGIAEFLTLRGGLNHAA